MNSRRTCAKKQIDRKHSMRQKVELFYFIESYKDQGCWKYGA